ncbi:flagellar hook-length control protein FliK [Roseivivax isoporae]|uniref:Flagellar hook-length control protein-like C-terminal domain-containing protein n=1 Tax=Roseivivax isoporae LMG 25204 TaxID=1449351 RepID=X7F822_9RHOB|nr:flagellar hook-length control protein FliK [Roseivivax isoporae]ETX28883.1 hypothetical protein RISW2_04010 [Roseivivax isoporae LMG 25204]
MPRLTPEEAETLAETLRKVADDLAATLDPDMPLSAAGLDRMAQDAMAAFAAALAEFDAAHGTSVAPALGAALAERLSDSAAAAPDAALRMLDRKLGAMAEMLQKFAAGGPGQGGDARVPGTPSAILAVAGRTEAAPGGQAMGLQSAGPELPTRGAEAAMVTRADPIMPPLSPEARGPVPAVQAMAQPEAAPRAEPPTPHELSRHLMAQIARSSVTEGRTRIELSPAGLGALEIEIETGADGQLRAVLRAENPAVLAALRGDRAGLAAAMSDGGLALNDAGLDFEDLGEPRHGAAENADLPRGGRPGDDATDEPPPPDPVRPHRTGGTGRLDILT